MAEVLLGKINSWPLHQRSVNWIKWHPLFATFHMYILYNTREAPPHPPISPAMILKPPGYVTGPVCPQSAQ
jgi:hypothetical protein